LSPEAEFLRLEAAFAHDLPMDTPSHSVPAR
jgi:hypothetical protein